MDKKLYHTSSPEGLTRRQKLLRRTVPLLALIAAGAGGALALSGEGTKIAPEEAPSVKIVETGEAVIGTSESGWTQGAATEAIEKALSAAIPKALSKVGADDGGHTLHDTIEDLPKYDEASDAISFASKDQGPIPDPGDKLRVDVEVTATKKGVVTYTVAGASYEDIPNN